VRKKRGARVLTFNLLCDGRRKKKGKSGSWTKREKGMDLFFLGKRKKAAARRPISSSEEDGNKQGNTLGEKRRGARVNLPSNLPVEEEIYLKK